MEAELIISHAGMGTIIDALVMSKPILIMPRRVKFRESRSDHQLGTVERFSDRNGIYTVADPSFVAPMLNNCKDILKGCEIKGAEPYAEERLISVVREFIVA
jgi:UDP-N-acetylglucosamine transferase subunit ALG13